MQVNKQMTQLWTECWLQYHNRSRETVGSRYASLQLLSSLNTAQSNLWPMGHMRSPLDDFKSQARAD